MLVRLLRLFKPLTKFFQKYPNPRALKRDEWDMLRQCASVLDPAIEVVTRVQGGSGLFIGEAINMCKNLEASFSDPGQDIRSEEDFDAQPVSTLSLELHSAVQRQLEILQQEMEARNLGAAVQDVEILGLALDPRYKTACRGVCTNGGPMLKTQVKEAMDLMAKRFEGSIPAPVDVGVSTAVNQSGGANRESKPRSRMDRIRERERLAMEVAPSRAVKPGTRSREQALQMEFAEYMLEDPVDETDLLMYWKGKSTAAVDPDGHEVVRPRWPHLALLARLHAGVDNTSCEAERNFSALALTASDLRSSLSPDKIKQMLFLRQNGDLIPEVGKYQREMACLKERCLAGRLAVQKKLAEGKEDKRLSPASTSDDVVCLS